jgi:hypothetical protein
MILHIFLLFKKYTIETPNIIGLRDSKWCLHNLQIIFIFFY